MDLTGAVVGVEGDMLERGLRLEDWKLSWSLSPDSSVTVMSPRGSPPSDSGDGVGLCLSLRRLLRGGEEQEAVLGLDCTAEGLVSSWR